MRGDATVYCLLATAIYASFCGARADSQLLKLNSNPFARPEIVNRKPAPILRNDTVAALPVAIELKLIATLVSESAPMVIVDGELIGLGEKIEGLTLVEVREGEATFKKGGKKYVFKIAGRDED